MANAKKNYSNGRCCVFQPFDGGEFDRRFDDVLVPSIEAADMEPYRVDRDAGAAIPIETLHQEIRSVVICVADITTRNPNVMYELGYAIAAGKDVVIICGPSTEKFPFDIQHRNVIRYTVGSISDLKKLEEGITARLKAILGRQEKTSEIAAASPVQSSDGLQPHEISVLAFIAANTDALEDSVSAWSLKQDMKRAGYNEIATRLSLAKLVRLGLATSDWDRDPDGEPYVVYKLTEAGESWLLDNQTRLQLQSPAIQQPTSSDEAVTDDDVPF